MKWVVMPVTNAVDKQPSSAEILTKEMCISFDLISV